MSNVVDFPSSLPDEVKEDETELALPPVTEAALEDVGWMAATLLIIETGRQVFGINAMIDATPDPEGFFQNLEGKPDTKPGIFVTVSSVRLPGLAASMVMPFETASLFEARSVMQEMAVQLRHAEEQKIAQSQHNKLIVPEKKLIIPGQE